MTREEEIKERFSASQCTSKGIKYIMDAKDILRENAEADIRYLLARNEELQRRVESMEKVVEAAKNVVNGVGDPFLPSAMGVPALPRLIDKLLSEIDRLSTIDAADAPQSIPELAPVYPGPDLMCGDFVYTPDGQKAEVYNATVDDGVFTSQGQFCASVLRREKTAADAEEE